MTTLDMPTTDTNNDLMGLAIEVVSAYVSHNSLSATDLTRMLVDVYQALSGLGSARAAPPAPDLVPAVSVRKSVTPDYIVCLDDGKQFKSLKRHLALLGMTPAEYRAKWNLPSDYPMVAPTYAATRSDLAKTIGLGRKHGAAAVEAAAANEVPEVTPLVPKAPKRGRPKKVPAAA